MSTTQLMDVMPAVTSLAYTEDEAFLIQQALDILERHVLQPSSPIECPDEVRDFLRLKMGREDHEVFAVLFLDTHHRLLAFEVLFHGTINALHVHPRRILQRALEHNCAAIILVHNHPSGVTTPSWEDQQLTTNMKRLLAELDIQLLDQFIVGQRDIYSFAEHGLL